VSALLVALPLLFEGPARYLPVAAAPPMPQHRSSPLRHRLALAFALTAALAARDAAGVSKLKIAAIGDGAPGGGVFAGPGFAGWPSAAGDGWVAFRGQIAAGTTSEELVVARMTAPVTRTLVASIGQNAPGAEGTFKQFVGRPSVNARGDVAFLALIAPTDPAVADDPFLPTPAALFLYRGGKLGLVARSGQQTPDGVLDLVGSVSLLSDPDAPEVTERSPAVTEAGDVAFLAALTGANTDGAIFVAPAAGGLVTRLRIADPFDGGEILTLGPPAMNAAGVLAFHASATTSDPADDDGLVDGIFTAGPAGLAVVVRDGAQPMPLDQPLSEFQDPVALNDNGDVVFLAGPLFDPSEDADPTSDGIPGVVAVVAGVPRLAGYPGQQIGADRVTGLQLGVAGGSELAAPAIGSDGSVVFFASMNGGSVEAILRWTGGDTTAPVVYTAGGGAGETPAGGRYAGAGSAPAVDAAGGVVFFARITSGATSEAVIYRPLGAGSVGIVVGDAAPNAGFFAGPPFAAPLVNDRGDVVFHAFVARGPASAGLFRARDGNLAPLVRTGDPAPVGSGASFLEFVGQAALSETAVAFAANVSGVGRGVYVVDDAGVRAVAVRGTPGPSELGTNFTFSGIGPNPDVNDAGTVAFRGTIAWRDPLLGINEKRDGLFVADASGIRSVAFKGEASPAGLPFFKFQDPTITSAGDVAFRATLGSTEEVTSALFLVTPAGTLLVAAEDADLGGGVRLTGFTGRPAAGGGSDLTFLASRARPFAPGSPLLRQLGPAILRRTDAGIDLVVARDMPGPAGGSFRSLGSPTTNNPGHVAFRGSFLPGTGGTAGIFLARDGVLTPHVLVGENTPLGGQFTSFGGRIALNARDEIAFIAGVGRGRARNGLFVTSPTVLSPRLFKLRLSKNQARDRLRLRLRLELGRRSDGVLPGSEAVVVSLADTRGPLWTATASAGRLKKEGKAFVLKLKRKDPLRKQLRALRLRVGKGNRVELAAESARLDLTASGFRTLRPPFTLSVQVGDDAGSAAVDCRIAKRGVRCGR
jgi:hypothetical protein